MGLCHTCISLCNPRCKLVPYVKEVFPLHVTDVCIPSCFVDEVLCRCLLCLGVYGVHTYVPCVCLRFVRGPLTERSLGVLRFVTYKMSLAVDEHMYGAYCRFKRPRWAEFPIARRCVGVHRIY